MTDDRTHTARILVVEDDRSQRDLLRFALQTNGWRGAVAENAQHGLSQLATLPPDAVVLDVGLPDIDGLAFCRRLRRAGNHGPVLMVSGRSETQGRLDGLHAGADDYLGKPYDVGELRARLRALLRRAGEVGPAPLTFAELRLDRDRHGVWVHDEF